MADIRYVRFQRGTPAAYEKLTNPSPDTLYFISEHDAKDGKLYLGSKLIAGSALTDLTDFDNDIELVDGLVLTYDGESGKWIAATPDSVVKKSGLIRVMKPATADQDGLAGYVPQPLAGDENKFLNGSGHWVAMTADLTEEDKVRLVEEIKEVVISDAFKEEIAENVKNNLGKEFKESIKTEVVEEIKDTIVIEMEWDNF